MAPLRYTLLLFLLCATTPWQMVQARSFTVHSEGDQPDWNPGDGVCSTGHPLVFPRVCTLRAAIMEANAVPVFDEITIDLDFDFLPIVLGANLPAITHSLSISGPGLDEVPDKFSLPIIEGAGQFRPFTIAASDVTIRNLRVYDGFASVGGALSVEAGASALVRDVQFDRNRADIHGGAVFSAGTLVLEDFDLVGNESLSGLGGAIYSGHATDLTARRGSIRRSRASSVHREAVYVGLDANVVFENVLIYGLDLEPGATGNGGIRASQPDVLRLDHVTLNHFTNDALSLVTGAGANGVPSTVRVQNSILAGSTGLDCSLTIGGSPSIQFAYVLVEDDSCPGSSGATSITGLGPSLLPLASDPSRFARYRTPSVTSPAVDAGDPDPLSDTACLPTDMRGTPRPLEGNAMGQARCDLGAIEAPLFTSNTYIVNSASEGWDAELGDGVCETAVGNGICTLRAAVMEANAKPGPDIIAFAPGALSIDLSFPAAAGAGGGDLDITEGLTITGTPPEAIGTSPASLRDTARVRIGQTRAGERIFEVQTTDVVVFQRISMAPEIGTAPLVPTSGGAVRIAGGGIVQMLSVDIRGHRSDAAGGAVSVVDGHLLLAFSDLWMNESRERGAALFVGAAGIAQVYASSLWGNRIADDTVSLRDAVHVEQGGRISIQNSTIAFNDGGIVAPFPAHLEIMQSTVAYNDGHGLWAGFGNPGHDETVVVRSSLFSNNGIDCHFQSPFLAETLDRNNFNLDASGSACSTGASNVVGDPALVVPPPVSGEVVLERPAGQLSRVLRPLHQSVYDNPALDAVPPSDCLGEDQIGTPRPVQLPDMTDGAGTCDIGALEVTRSAGVFSDGFED